MRKCRHTSATWPPHRSRARRIQSGYVLVVTLGLLILAATLMVSVSRAAMGHAVAARRAAQELQRRWAVVSCRMAVLPNAESILATAEAQRRGAMPIGQVRIQLGEYALDLTIADELAKANVNALLDHADRTTAEGRLRVGLAGTGLMGHLKLRPVAAEVARDGAAAAAATGPASRPAAVAAGLPQWVSGFGQVFDDASAERLLESHGGVRAAELLTCWGGGKINLMRVSPAALRIVGGSLTMIEQRRLLEARDAVWRGERAVATGSVVENDPVRRLLLEGKIDARTVRDMPPLTTGSTCHSLWIVLGDRHRSWHYFSVLDRGDEKHPRSAGFVW